MSFDSSLIVLMFSLTLAAKGDLVFSEMTKVFDRGLEGAPDEVFLPWISPSVEGLVEGKVRDLVGLEVETLSLMEINVKDRPESFRGCCSGSD